MTGGESLVAAAFDAVPMQVAVLDADGDIVRVNEAWRRFGRENDATHPTGFVGESYLAACEGGESGPTAAGIQAVLDGERDAYVSEYPCHEPDGDERWFSMRAVRFEEDGERYALLVHRDVTERTLAERRQEAYTDQLETVARVLSHDLRNPMGVALGHAELLAESGDGGDPDAVVSAVERMEAIVEDALTLARGADVEATEPVDLATAARTAWSHVDTAAATLDVADAGTVMADRDLLGQLLENLFRNAVEHAGRDATVTVEGTTEGFAVADDGPGIDPADREAVFEAGYSEADDGTGFGLAIVERIATAHGWSVSAGAADDGGARFAVTGVDRGDPEP